MRITGPEHIQPPPPPPPPPGAPNKWQIETLRHGGVGRPQKLDVIVKDSRRQRTVARDARERGQRAATLELNAAFWSKVDPGTELFMEVVAHDDNNTSVLAERLPLASAGLRHAPRHRQAALQAGRNDPLPLTHAQPLDAALPPEHEMHLLFTPAATRATLSRPSTKATAALLSGLKPVLGPDNKPLRGIGVGEFMLPGR